MGSGAVPVAKPELQWGLKGLKNGTGGALRWSEGFGCRRGNGQGSTFVVGDGGFVAKTRTGCWSRGVRHGWSGTGKRGGGCGRMACRLL